MLKKKSDTEDIKYADRLGYDTRHGGPFDRGEADSYYRKCEGCPHYYVGATDVSERVDEKDMTESEIQQYWAGFNWNEKFGCRKDFSY